MVRKILTVFFLLGASLSHTLWINSTSYYARKGDNAIVLLGWGHHFPIADFIDPKLIKEYGLITPSNKKIQLPPLGKFFESPVNFKEEGYYFVYAYTKSGFYTMTLVKGKVFHYQKPMDQVEGKIIVSNCYQEFAKALLKVGDGDYPGFSRAVNLKMEIIPLENPSSLRLGDFLKLKILLDGRPLPFVPVYATYEGFSTGDDYAYATESDSNGIAKIRVLHWGRWLIKAHFKKLPQGEKAKKCKMISLVSTLTLEVK